ncbi:hypothetical protein KI387_023378 [Taxus chinensis]|uniref:Uncharacterized protein n=1 Tax=Taxus chinensis TaxID=29808 RepID=A0AA38L801_TAXCH|nr:hypothetical protein KI387_023378 [Taxus chinensis]
MSSMAMAMNVVEKWELLWYWDNVIWPAPTCENGRHDHLEPESEQPVPEPEVAVACTSSNDGGEKNSGYLKGMEEQEKEQHERHDPGLGLFERRHRRSLSDDMRLDMSKLSNRRKEGSSSLNIIENTTVQPSFIKEAQPIKIHKVAKLETIASGKEYKEPTQGKLVPKIQQKAPWHTERKRGTKSLTDLEFDEVKGFSELGFTFSEKDLTPRVVQIIPGLQRLGKQGATYVSNHNVSRPYPSEDWLMCKPDPPLRNLRMPAPSIQAVDMKEHLKFWAQAVASTVKMEC